MELLINLIDCVSWLINPLDIAGVVHGGQEHEAFRSRA